MQVLIVGGVIVAATWQENCGGESTSLARQFYSAAATIAKGERHLHLGRAFVTLWPRSCEGAEAGEPRVASLQVQSDPADRQQTTSTMENKQRPPCLNPSLCVATNSLPPSCFADERVALLGVMQALFEASMYTFVFLWTPALNPHTFVPSSGNGSSTAASIMGRSLTSTGALPSTTGEGAETEPHLPHGLVFAIFMTASMVGTALAGRLMASWRLETVLQVRKWALRGKG